MNATVFLQKCSKTNKLFGVRIEQMDDGEWYRTWAFPIDERRANREGYQNVSIRSSLPVLESYPGCPYCGSKSTFYDCNCKKITCWNGEKRLTCPWCNETYDVIIATEKLFYDVSGGDV